MTTGLDTLIVASTPQEILALELQIATSLGLPTTAWQPVQTVPALLNINATIASDYSSTVAFLAQGGYASLAALMVDGNGNPITTWMDLRGQDQYGLVRIPASFASGTVPVFNSTGTTYPYAPNNPLHFQNPISGATYTSSGTGNIAPGGNAPSVNADVAGSPSTTGAGITLVMTTPLNGVTVSPLTTSLVGTDAESNNAYLIRCQGLLANISPNGAAQAYSYLVGSIAQGTPSSVYPYAVSAALTRVGVSTSPGTGYVIVTCANAAGAPPAGDVTVANAVIQSQCVPLGVLALVQGATNSTVNVAYTVFVKTSSGLTSAQITTNIADALANLFATFPIGGYNSGLPGGANYVPLALVSDAIMNSNAGTIDCLVSLNGALLDLALLPINVAVLNVSGAAVILVSG